MAEKEQKGKQNLISLFKKWGFVIIVMLILIKLNKTVFFLLLFSFASFTGKFIRNQFGLRMVILDPLLFSSILIAKFFGIPILILFLFVNVFVADLMSGLFSPGSFLNYVLYNLSPIIGVLFFGNLSMMIYGNIASLIYSVSYVFFRTTVLPDDPVQVFSKAITSVVFTFLYLSFFGPLFQVLMS